MTHDTTEADEQIAAYVEQVAAIVVALDEYEQAHPKGAPCFLGEVTRMKEALSL